MLGIMASMFVMPVHAQTPTSEFGYQLHPEKLLENTEGILQIFVISNEIMVPKQIENLKAISSDNSIIEILGIEEGNDEFTNNILLKAKKPGISGIVLAAPGFSSKEISLEVFNNNNYPTQMLMKITPEEFPIDGPKYGHIALEVATTGGLPTLTPKDITIHLDTPNKDVIKLKNSEVIINSGEYYIITEFEIIGSGNAIIFAETEGMAKISGIVNVLEPKGPLELKLYAFPENYNSYSGTRGFAIVQLQDADGEPVLAEEDIHLKLNIENPDISINTSHDFKEVLFDKEELVIEKGTYSSFTQFTPRPNLGDITALPEQEYSMFISAAGYLTTPTSITILHDQVGALEGEGPAVTKVLPFLTTGKDEIIAVTYYETEIEVSRQSGGSTSGSTNRVLTTVTVPVQAKADHSIIFSSSELDTVSPIHPTMKQGENVAIVFGETGTVAPAESVSFSITDNEGVKTIVGEPIGPIEEDISIVMEPLVPMILAEKQFPALVYLLEGSSDGEEVTTVDEEAEVDPRLGVTPFIEDGVLTFSANEYVETDYVTVKQNQPYVVMDMMSKEVGTTSLSYQMGGFEGNTGITSYTTDPTEIYVAFSNNVLINSKTLATIQLLDSIGNPVYAKKDTSIKLVSNNEDVVKIPQEIVIKNNEYFTTFELEAIKEGQVELALLSEDFALSKYDIDVVDVSPILSLNLLGDMNWNERVEAQLSVTIPQITTALDGFIVEWEANGGEIRSMDEVTNNAGIATLNIIANDADKISITATVSGNGLSSTTISKTVDILNVPIIEAVEETESSTELPLDTITIIFIIIPVAVGGTLFFLKRIDKLDMITEKIPIGDKIEEIKEKISDIRNR